MEHERHELPKHLFYAIQYKSMQIHNVSLLIITFTNKNKIY